MKWCVSSALNTGNIVKLRELAYYDDNLFKKKFLQWTMWIIIPCIFSCSIDRKPTIWANRAQYVLLFWKWCVIRLSLSTYAKTVYHYHLKKKNKYDMWLTLFINFKTSKTKMSFKNCSWTYRYDWTWSKHVGCRKHIFIYH